MRESSNPVLIISASGRALAASAVRAGLSCVVLDLFNDMDTRELARASRACATRKGGFHGEDLLRSARALRPAQGYEACVIGSGLESRLPLMKTLAREFPYLGNEPECIEHVKDPKRFFLLLDSLRIGHPEVLFPPPRALHGWLSKRIGGAGGGHVRRAELGWPGRERRYFQRYQAGRLLSALFLADGKRGVMVGYSEPWCHSLSRHISFAYGGAVTLDDPSESVRHRLERAVNALICALGLRGLNGVDFILEHDEIYVLEVNPRPTATSDLHDHRVAGGLLRAHMAACRGTLPKALVSRNEHCAHGIVWSAGAWSVTKGFRWPEWISDIPSPGSFIPARRPLCSVHSRAPTSVAAKKRVCERMEIMSSMLWPLAA